MQEFKEAHAAWYEMRTCKKLAIHNFLNYIKHKRIAERCNALIDNAINPHTPNELIAAPSVLAYINKLSKSVI